VGGNWATTAAHTPAADAGTVIAGRYKLLQQIGEGGMGTVWMADQTEPVKRRVAVKLIRADKGQSRTILARFEAERQAIALMDHPHIARLLDAGTTGESPSPPGGGVGEGSPGQPFFVMELVKGVPLTDFCDAHRLTITERLHLFTQVCGAVQHAHQKGVIHRDLKPSNILVESHDGKPVPKVIDFGLAKATTGLQLSDHTLFTAFGSVMGTPLYMAPEQASFNAVDVDTRADVYALGAVLYELLTGTTPLTRGTLRKAALDEVLRVVREQDPPTPSHRLSTADGAPSVAANRQTEPKKLGRFVRGELDWIVMKALAKDRDRRYETATGLARDVDRFLNHEPVQAGPPTAGYKLRKFVARNKGPVAAAGVVLLALVLGAAGTTWGMVRADQARQAEADRAEGERRAKEEAERERDDKERARAAEAREREKAVRATELAEGRLAMAQRGSDLIGAVFHDLDPDAEVKEGRPLRAILADRLAAAADRLDAGEVADPPTVAALQKRLAVSLVNLGRPARAVPLMEKAVATRAAALGRDHPDTLAAQSDLGTAHLAAGNPGEAIRLLEDVLQRVRAAHGPEHPATLPTLNNLAQAYLRTERTAQTVALFEDYLRLTRAARGPDHPDALTALDRLALAYTAAGRPEEAVRLHAEALPGLRAALGEDHPDTLAARNNLAVALRRLGRAGEALPLVEECYERIRVARGPDHPYTLAALSNLGRAYLDGGRPDEAVRALEECVRRGRATVGSDHHDTRTAAENLALAYVAVGRPDDAVRDAEAVYRSAAGLYGPEHPRTLEVWSWYAWRLGRVGRPAEAAGEYRRLLPAAHRVVGPDWGGRAAQYARDYAQFTLNTGHTDPEATAAARVLIAGRDHRLAPALTALGADLLRQRRWTDAEPVLREVLTHWEAVRPSYWATSNTRSMLGGALLGQGKAAEAEPLLVAGYAGLVADRANIPPTGRNNLPEAADRLVELYEKLGKPEEVKRWRAERAKYPPPAAPPPRPVGR
jgi:serine/threonine protein kinase/tetratricopeptide (TPR) repeat protein